MSSYKIKSSYLCTRSPTMYTFATGKDKIFLPDMQIAGIPGTLLSDGIDSAFSIHKLCYFFRQNGQE